MKFTSLLTAIVAALALPTIVVAADGTDRNPATSAPYAAEKPDRLVPPEAAAQPATRRVKPHNHNEFHKQGAPTANKPEVTATVAKPLHDHGQTHKQQ
jgi:hypothetical protein